jgi:GDP-L-fucose synthase
LDHLQVKQHFDKYHYDVVIHTATYDAVPAHYNKDPNKVLDNNLRMFFNIENCSGRWSKLINLGSGAEYGRQHWIPKMNEVYFGEHIPSDPYGFSKYICSRFAESNMDDNTYHLRLFAVFGKYEDWRVRFLSNAICRNIHGLPIKINQNRKFDFLDVNDLMVIFDRFINRLSDSVFTFSLDPVMNVCSGRVYDFITLAKMINDIGQGCGNNPVRLDVIEPGEGLEYSGANHLLLNDIGDFNFTPIENSLKNLYQWYLERKDDIDPRLL